MNYVTKKSLITTQYPRQVQYLDNERKLGVILGPIPIVKHEQFNCSPLLSTPKDIDKRCVILNLSYPYGQSVNDHVDKLKFDQSVRHIHSQLL